MNVISQQIVANAIGHDCAGIVDNYIRAIYQREHYVAMLPTRKFFTIVKFFYKEQPKYRNTYNLLNFTTCFVEPYDGSINIVKTTNLANISPDRGAIFKTTAIVSMRFYTQCFMCDYWKSEALPNSYHPQRQRLTNNYNNMTGSNMDYRSGMLNSFYALKDISIISHRSEPKSPKHGYGWEWECKICCHRYKTEQSMERHSKSKKHIDALFNMRRGRLFLKI